MDLERKTRVAMNERGLPMVSNALPGKPIRVHKRLLIHLLDAHPEELDDLITGWKGTAEEAVEYLQNGPREYLDEFDED